MAYWRAYIKTKISLFPIIAAAFSLAYGLAFSLISVHRFWQYEVFYYDFGIFASAILSLSRLQPPIIDHLAVGRNLIFADHVSPSIFLLTPVYWITHKPEALLVAQAIIVAASGWMLFVIGNKILKNGFLALSIMVSYLLFVGLQNALIFDFHEVTVMTLPLMLTFWSVLVVKNKRLFWIFFLITLGCKESTFLLGLGIACMLWFTSGKYWRRTAIGAVVVSALWGYVTTQMIIPFLSHAPYAYSPSFEGGISDFLGSLINPPIKRRTLFLSGISFGFLPLLSPVTWPLVFQDIITRFVPKVSSLRWDLGLHYSAQLAPILGVSSVLGAKILLHMKYLKKFAPVIAGVCILIAVYLHQFVLHGPLGLAYNRAFYAHTKNFTFLDNLLSRVPTDGVVMAQNNLAPHLLHTHTIRILHDAYTLTKPDYIVLDAREGQNPNNWFGVKDFPGTFHAIKTDPEYNVLYTNGQQYIFVKK